MFLVTLLAVEKAFEYLMALLVKLFPDKFFEGFSWNPCMLVPILVFLPVWVLVVLFLSFPMSRIETLIRRRTIAHLFIVRFSILSNESFFGSNNFIESVLDE